MTPPRAGLNRTAVIDAAVVVADREGLDGLSLRAIAAAVGVRSPSLYNHVGGLADVRAGLRLRAFEELRAAQACAVEGRPVEEWLPLLPPVHRTFAREHPGLYAATHATTQRSHENSDVRRASERVFDDLVQAVSPYGLTDEDAVHAVRALRSLVVGFNSLERAGHFGMPVSVERSFNYLVGLLIAGLGGSPPTSARGTAVAH